MTKLVNQFEKKEDRVEFYLALADAPNLEWQNGDENLLIPFDLCVLCGTICFSFFVTFDKYSI